MQVLQRLRVSHSVPSSPTISRSFASTSRFVLPRSLRPEKFSLAPTFQRLRDLLDPKDLIVGSFSELCPSILIPMLFSLKGSVPVSLVEIVHESAISRGPSVAILEPGKAGSQPFDSCFGEQSCIDQKSVEGSKLQKMSNPFI